MDDAVFVSLLPLSLRLAGRGRTWRGEREPSVGKTDSANGSTLRPAGVEDEDEVADGGTVCGRGIDVSIEE